jgi:hypothetical protein
VHASSSGLSGIDGPHSELESRSAAPSSRTTHTIAPRPGRSQSPSSSARAICPLVCEDLARPDPVTDVVRSIAPTLVVALLLDGPQLAARWPARYASVLADDPGCSVLTLTALGMTQRSQPPGHARSRGIALWTDPHRGLQQIALAEAAHAVALTAHVRQCRSRAPTVAPARRSRSSSCQGSSKID